jgi:hypothetical protein
MVNKKSHVFDWSETGTAGTPTNNKLEIYDLAQKKVS